MKQGSCQLPEPVTVYERYVAEEIRNFMGNFDHDNYKG